MKSIDAGVEVALEDAGDAASAGLAYHGLSAGGALGEQAPPSCCYRRRPPAQDWIALDLLLVLQDHCCR